MTNLKFQSVFDIMGPVMIGPSSSHTAGAVRISKIVSSIFWSNPPKLNSNSTTPSLKHTEGMVLDVALVAKYSRYGYG